MIRQSGHYQFRPGRRHPAGATVEDEGVNFSVYSRHATGADLLLYEGAESPEPFQVISLDPEVNHTFFSWHLLVVDLPPGTHYTWRMQGPNDPKGSGWRFDAEVELVDPWARAVNSCGWERWVRQREGIRPHDSPRGVVIAEDYDWEGDTPPHLPAEQVIIYEMHVGGFTRHASSGVRSPGTFAGVIEKIPYLQSLGITHVELMPVMAFDEQDVPEQVWDQGLTNYWGYSTHSFFSPHPGYCISPRDGTHRSEFRDMVKALHRAGIGVILDVVFNHTAEGAGGGPVLNLKGFGNETFYMLDQIDKSVYLDFTGCGNTINANHPFVARFILDCLEYWVRRMHVDGFRFDLASALARDEYGQPMHNPPLLWGIELSDVLARSEIIAEAWDAAGLYQVGTFPGYRWMEWNGRYRDSVRRFVRGDPGILGEVASRIAGSSDLYQANLRLPINSVNFVTCHDGYTLWDLVSYERKNNAANGEHNRDGTNDNLSWNCGSEGESDDPKIQALRRRQAKNFLSILFLSQGVPMLLAGDEVLRSQGGNNNAWCQDNETGWFDWTLVERNADMLRFVAELIALRKRHPTLQRRRFLSGRARNGSLLPDISWHGPETSSPQWDDPDGRALAFTLAGMDVTEEDLHVLLNMSDETQVFVLPVLSGRSWHLALDTDRPTPEDIAPPDEQSELPAGGYRVCARSLVVLEGR
ncbi:MAG: glycogen debranching protein GlgX [Pseudomonadota bacterium]|nr:glycogen debranching protein GlgX [Pseudomonadota bacterium]